MTDSPRPQTRARSPGVEQRAAYRIQAQGTIGASWAAWFEGAVIEQHTDSITFDTVVDQAALCGLLCRLWDLNLIVISVNRAAAGAPIAGGTSNE